ncbi:hypothetical protein GUITHDRAFT_68419, partial [Guillardia theta CCMP2712]
MRWLELSQVWKTVKEGNDKSPWDDKQTILSILQRRGSLIGKVSEAHRRDVDLIRAAVAENGMCLRYADSTLRKDMSFVRMAVEENGKALMFADEQLQADDDLLWRALHILQRRGSLIGKVSEAHRRDVDLIRAAVAENGMCLRYADSTLRKDMPFVRMAVEENGKALMFAD